jgi:hypothetical protein
MKEQSVGLSALIVVFRRKENSVYSRVVQHLETAPVVFTAPDVIQTGC